LLVTGQWAEINNCFRGRVQNWQRSCRTLHKLAINRSL
jgi:hypothetical protein